MPKFQPNDRVVYQDLEHPTVPNWSHTVTLENDRVVHLNHRGPDGRILPFTATVNRLMYTDQEGREYYSIRPDGWPDGSNFRGFEADAMLLRRLADPGQVTPCTITDNRGEPEKTDVHSA